MIGYKFVKKSVFTDMEETIKRLQFVEKSNVELEKKLNELNETISVLNKEKIELQSKLNLLENTEQKTRTKKTTTETKNRRRVRKTED